MMATVDAVTLRPRPVAASVDELLAGATRLGAMVPVAARSTAGFERVVLDGEPCVVKYLHPDDDFAMRASGDIGCRALRVWASGLMDLAPDLIDHGHLGAAPWGRNGWGAALLMRDVGAELVPEGNTPLGEEQHHAFLGHCAGLAARSWLWHDDQDLLPHAMRWAMFAPSQLAEEERLGFPEPVPRFAVDGWRRFPGRVPADLAVVMDALVHDPEPLSAAIRTTPQCFLHGDWKLGNLGCAADGRTVLIDWVYPGEGPILHELGWYLALNRSRLPAGETKESTIDAFRAALDGHGVATDEWWDRQLGLCLLGALVQFGWEKALGDDVDSRAELGWWSDAARDGARYL